MEPTDSHSFITMLRRAYVVPVMDHLNPAHMALLHGLSLKE
jgi:hypothetical protein